jgi:Type IV secretion-system coupling protein DNA-binding domain
MPSFDRSPDPGVQLMTSIHELIHWLVATTIHVALGWMLSRLAARELRRRHLHWTWTLVALAFVLVARPLLGGLALTLTIASLVAGVRARRWRRQDLRAGLDLADLAAGQYGPLALVSTLSERIGALLERIGARQSRPARERWFGADGLTIGHDARRRAVAIPLGGEAGGSHALVVGAAGSGKTVTQTWIASRAIEHGSAAIVIDPKGDRDLRHQLNRAAQLAGKRFIEWTPDGDTVYNPYRRGSETEIADKALAGERFTEPHYLRQAQRYLGQEVRALRLAGQEISVAKLVAYLEPARLELLARNLPEADANSVHAYLDALTPRQRGDLAGVRDRLAIMAESDIGRWLDPDTPGTTPFDLLQAIESGMVVYFSLESERRPLLAQMLAAAIIQDLLTATVALQSAPVPCLVMIDEFSAIAAEHVVRLFGRARSAGMSIVLGTQELADMRLPGREGLLEQILGNLSALIAHRQVVPESTELIANVVGTNGVWSTSHSSDGRVTYKRAREFRIHPNEISRLSRGHAVVVRLADGCDAHVARILSAAQDG